MYYLCLFNCLCLYVYIQEFRLMEYSNHDVLHTSFVITALYQLLLLAHFMSFGTYEDSVVPNQ